VVRAAYSNLLVSKWNRWALDHRVCDSAPGCSPSKLKALIRCCEALYVTSLILNDLFDFT
jgi:hypothetical protein